eukprot:10591805-Lingulodinium_polyedra.AAC.1
MRTPSARALPAACSAARPCSRPCRWLRRLRRYFVVGADAPLARLALFGGVWCLVSGVRAITLNACSERWFS